MTWRATAAEARHPDGAHRQKQLESRVKAGVPIGLLGYDGGAPAAWCSLAPRDTHRASMADAQPGDDQAVVWSLVCFYVPRAARGRGTFDQLVQAALAHAHAHGATVLEAYPVDEDAPSYRFGGFVTAFERLGFTRVGRAGTRRHVVRHTLP
jgi:GNAT superfamily N-acetyltransferase